MIKHFTTVGFFTLLSRILGFFRDRIFASVLGAGPVADAFLVAFRFPNLFRRIFAEGAFNAAFVPLYARKLSESGEEEARLFAADILSLLVSVLLLLTAVMEIVMPWAIYVLAPGFDAVEGKIELAALLSHITFPYLIFASLMAMFSGILNAHGKFAVAAFAPVILNLCLWSTLFVAQQFGLGDEPQTVIYLSIAVTLAGVLQAGLVIWSVRRLGFRFRFAWPKITPDIKHFFAIGLPVVVAGGITQINIVVGSLIASAEESAVSYLYYADRIYQLPLGIVGAGVGVVLLPELTRQIYSSSRESVMQTQNRAFDFAMLLTLPAAAAMIVIAGPIISVIYEQNAFGPEDALATSEALAAFAFGLPAFVLIKVFQPAFFAREDMKTPTYIAGINAAINIVMSFALFPIYGHIGIAIATSIAAWSNVILLAGGLMRRGIFLPDALLFRRLAGSLIACAVMGFVIDQAALYCSEALAADSAVLLRFGALGLVTLVGMMVYFLVSFATGALRRSDLAMIKRRGK